jgi:hypothetical protein
MRVSRCLEGVIGRAVDKGHGLPFACLPCSMALFANGVAVYAPPFIDPMQRLSEQLCRIKTFARPRPQPQHQSTFIVLDNLSPTGRMERDSNDIWYGTSRRV